jgi:hypothetical protein
MNSSWFASTTSSLLAPTSNPKLVELAVTFYSIDIEYCPLPHIIAADL